MFFHRTGNQNREAVDQGIRRQSPLVQIFGEAAEYAQTLPAGKPSAEDPGADDDKNGRTDSNHRAQLDEQEELEQGDDGE